MNPKQVLQQYDLRTTNCQLSIGVLASGHLCLLYFGRKLPVQTDLRSVIEDLPKASYLADTDGISDFRLEQLPLMYPAFGTPDLRAPAIRVRDDSGSPIINLKFNEKRLVAGKPALPGLPATHVAGEVKTWEFDLVDSVTGLTVTLVISTFVDYDIFTQSVRVKNTATTPLRLDEAQSLSLDLLSVRFDLVTLNGAWSRENHIQRTQLRPGVQGIDSKRGASGHGQNPFVALATPDTDWQHGEIYSANLIYSGNFVATATVDMHQNTRLQVGINPFEFEWKLSPGQSFSTPEVVFSYADKGFNQMSQRYHRFYLDCLLPKQFAKQSRPILINNWEATYFDFNRQKLLALAKQASELGIELFVLDDGWFGKRDDDSSSLGDWVANETKLGGSLSALATDIQALGLQFGLWVEPEMVSPNSDLYRQHPDWVMSDSRHRPQLARRQYVLDLSQSVVQDYLIKTIDQLLTENSIDYLKWDMNRNITDAYSHGLAVDQQGEVYHRYLLGLYHVLGTITTRHPQVLIESCAGGGGRFDAGMLAYTPQIWTSDDTDAYERLQIQRGTALIYPPVTMGSHVSAVPNHQVGRMIDLATRGAVAEQGNLGYELDLLTLTTTEKQQIQRQVTTYKAYRETLQFGRYTVLPVDEANEWAWSKVGYGFVIVDHITILARPNTVPKRLKVVGLTPTKQYQDVRTQRCYSGAFLMSVGLVIDRQNCDFASQRWIFKELH